MGLIRGSVVLDAWGVSGVDKRVVVVVLAGLSGAAPGCVRAFESSAAPVVDTTRDAPGLDTSAVDLRRGDAVADQPGPADAPGVDPLSPFSGATPVAALNTASADEEEPTLTADMLEIYFTRNAEIWHSTRTDTGSGWSAPRLLMAGAVPHRHPSVSADGLLLLYSSDESAQTREDINAMKRPSRSAPWGPPAPVSELNTTSKEFAGGMTPDTLQLALMRSTNTDFNLYLSTRGSTQDPWGAPQPIAAVNSPEIENRPWINHDATVIYFDSERTGAALRDIFVSVRPDPSALWAAPVAVTSLNTSALDSDVWLSPDLKTIYFSSDRDGGSMELFTATRE